MNPPHPFSPMLAELADGPFSDPDWIFETKWDGYRAIAEIRDGQVSLTSRNRQDFSETYPAITQALKKIRHHAVIDGEIVATDEHGRSQFQLLQDYRRESTVPLVFAAFDLLYLDGEDLRERPLLERKKRLKSIFPSDQHLVFTHHVVGKGEEMFRLAKEQGMEGVMAKRSDSPYLATRSGRWLKVKTVQTVDAIIAGFTAPQGTRLHFGALILGVYGDDGQLRSIGHTGSGFNDQSLADIAAQLKPLVSKRSPFLVEPETNAPATWVKPVLVCQVKFSEWTKDGLLRQPVFMGLRTDKSAQEVRAELVRPVGAKRSAFTNSDKVFWPEEGYTKGDLIAYYSQVAPFILPHLRDRPQSLNRHPDGITGPSFFQKDLLDHPDWVRTVPLRSESEGKDIHWLICNDLDTLLFMANLGCIELNPWISRYQKPDYPDFLLLDLDPQDVDFSVAVETAQEVKKLLDSVKLESFVKTSGKRGLHIVVPLGAKYTFTQTRQFAQILATTVFQQLPETTSVARNPLKRGKKVYIDFLQNRIGQTIAAPYSLRPVAHATVSTPLEWDELRGGLSPTDFTIRTIFKRLNKHGDLWKQLLEHKGIDMRRSLDLLIPEMK